MRTTELGRQTRQARQTDGQRRFYQENGYLIFENVLTDQELTELRVASEALQSERKKLGGETRLAVIHNVTLLHEAFLKTARHPFMLAVVSDLIGEDLRLQHAKLNWKPPTAGAGEVGWHQDFPFFPHTNYDLLACMFLLDDARIENGCMRMIPGSHTRGPVDHFDAGGAFVGHCTTRRSTRRTCATATWWTWSSPPGSMTVHHCCTLHASYPNRSDVPRRGLVYQIAAGDAIQLGGNLHKVWGTWLQGRDPLRARCWMAPPSACRRP